MESARVAAAAWASELVPALGKGAVAALAAAFSGWAEAFRLRVRSMRRIPEYSEEARKAKYQGTVVLWMIVDPNGSPRDVRVTRSLGMGLDQKAIEAVRKWKFEPAMKDGKPVAVQISVEVNFRLY